MTRLAAGAGLGLVVVFGMTLGSCRFFKPLCECGVYTEYGLAVESDQEDGQIRVTPDRPVQGCPVSFQWTDCYARAFLDGKSADDCQDHLALAPQETGDFAEVVDVVTVGENVHSESRTVDGFDLDSCTSRDLELPGLQAGLHEVVVQLDPDQEVEECPVSSENNIARAELCIECPCDGQEKYDLDVERLDFDAATWVVEWRLCYDYVPCNENACDGGADGPGTSEVLETIVVTHESGVAVDDYRTFELVMGECADRSLTVPEAARLSGDYTMQLTAATAECDCLGSDLSVDNTQELSWSIGG